MDNKDGCLLVEELGVALGTLIRRAITDQFCIAQRGST